MDFFSSSGPYHIFLNFRTKIKYELIPTISAKAREPDKDTIAKIYSYVYF